MTVEVFEARAKNLDKRLKVEAAFECTIAIFTRQDRMILVSIIISVRSFEFCREITPAKRLSILIFVRCNPVHQNFEIDLRFCVSFDILVVFDSYH